MATVTVENYLKQLLLLSSAGDELVSMGALAEALAVVPGTVTTMVKSLADGGLVEHVPRQGVRLTSEGRRLALGVLRKHRLVETFLVRVLAMDWSKVHAEAEELEHAVSDAVLDRLDVLLGHPTTDPHGDPIPSRQGKLDAQAYATLATCELNRAMKIVRITEQSSQFLEYAEENGLLPGTAVRVNDRNPAAGLLTLKPNGAAAFPLGLAAAAHILVEPAR